MEHFYCKKDAHMQDYPEISFTSGKVYAQVDTEHDYVEGQDSGYCVIDDTGCEHFIGLPGDQYFDEHFIFAEEAVADRPACLERDGARTIDLDFMGGVYRDHFWCHVDADGRLDMEVDNYHPDIEERWDAEEWEERKCFISAPADRSHWKIVYRIARALARHGKVTLEIGGRETMEVTCDRCELTF